MRRIAIFIFFYLALISYQVDATITHTPITQQFTGVYNAIQARTDGCTDVELQAAIDASGSSGKRILLSPVDGAGASCSWVLGANVTVPSTRMLWVPNETTVSNNGFTLTLNSPLLADNPHWHTGTGTVTYNYNRWSDTASYNSIFEPYVVSGGIHATAGSCTSASFATTYVAGGVQRTQTSTAIDYSSIGACNCSNPGSDTAWVIAGDPSLIGTLTNFTRYGSTDYYVDCTSTDQPALPSNSTWLFYSTITNGAISAVNDIRQFKPASYGGGNEQFVVEGCFPSVPSSSLTVEAFPCVAFLKDASRAANLLAFTQEPAALTVPDSATVWLGYHRDYTGTPSGCGGGNWSRVSGTHYLLCADGTQPADPDGGILIAKFTVAGSVITDVDDFRPTSPIKSQYVNVLDSAFAVTADGSTDTLAELLVAEDNAFNRGKSLLFPGSKSYAFDGQFLIRVSVSGYGATLIPLESDGVSWGNTLAAVSVNDIVIEGVTVDAGLRTAGIYLSSCDRCIVRKVTVNNTTDGGIRVFYSDDVIIEHSHIEDVRYGSSGGADGIYFTASLRPAARNNVIHDIRRIGVVCEQDGTTNSEDCDVLYNTIHDTHDLDDSVSEFNAAVWFENTDGGRIIGNTIYDISGNAGQTSRTPYGIVVSSGQERPSTYIIRDNTIDFGDGSVGSGFPISVSGTSQYSSVVIDGGYVGYAGFGVSIGGGLDAVSVRDVRFDNLNYTSTTSAAVSIDTAGSARISLDGIYPTNITKTSGDAQDVNIAAGGAGSLTITNSNVGLVNHGAASALGLLKISDSTIEFGNSSTDGTFDATVIHVDNATITPTSGRTDTVINLNGGAITAFFNNCRFINAPMPIGGSSAITLKVSNSYFSGSNFTVDTTGNVATRLFFDSNTITEYHATDGFLKMNFTSNSADELYVRNNDFTRSTDVTPLIQWNEGPNVVEIIGNTYNSTLLENFDAGGTLDNVTGNSAY